MSPLAKAKVSIINRILEFVHFKIQRFTNKNLNKVQQRLFDRITHVGIICIQNVSKSDKISDMWVLFHDLIENIEEYEEEVRPKKPKKKRTGQYKLAHPNAERNRKIKNKLGELGYPVLTTFRDSYPDRWRTKFELPTVGEPPTKAIQKVIKEFINTEYPGLTIKFSSNNTSNRNMIYPYMAIYESRIKSKPKGKVVQFPA